MSSFMCNGVVRGAIEYINALEEKLKGTSMRVVYKNDFGNGKGYARLKFGNKGGDVSEIVLDACRELLIRYFEVETPGYVYLCESKPGSDKADIHTNISGMELNSDSGYPIEHYPDEFFVSGWTDHIMVDFSSEFFFKGESRFQNLMIPDNELDFAYYREESYSPYDFYNDFGEDFDEDFDEEFDEDYYDDDNGYYSNCLDRVIKYDENGFVVLRDCLRKYNEKYTGLLDVSIPKAEIIGEDSFRYCNSIRSIVIPSGAAVIAKSAFGNCSSLTSVSIPDSVTDICDNAFEGCRSLSDIVLPDSLRAISKSAFKDCTELKSVIVPDKVAVIGDYAFDNCTELTDVTLPKNVMLGRSVFDGCEKLERITIPDGVVTLSEYAFKGCRRLTGITIPASVRKIGSSTFKGCKDLVIYAPANSYAMEYAKENNIKCEEI